MLHGLRRVSRISVLALSALICGAFLAATAAPAAAKVRAQWGVRGAGQLSFGGQITGPAARRVVVEYSVDGGPLRRGRSVAVRRGHYAGELSFSASAHRLRVRARTLPKAPRGRRQVSRWRSLSVGGLPPVTPVTVLTEGQVVSAAPGALVVGPAAAVAVGQVLVSGPSPALPLGLLARVTALTPSASGTTVSVEPAALTDVLPTGDLDLAVAEAPAVKAARARRTAVTSCEAALPGIGGSGLLSVDEAVSLSAGARLRASWHWGLPPTVRVQSELSETLKYAVTVNAGASVSCDLGRRQLNAAPLPLGTFAALIGPLPVVLSLQGNVFVRGSAELRSGASMGVAGKLTVHGGIAVDGVSVRPTGGVDPELVPTLPHAELDGTAEISVEPTVDAYLYDRGGLSGDIAAGLKLTGGPTQSPAWMLSAPLSGGFRLSLAVLGQRKETGQLEVFNHEFPLGDAGGIGGLAGTECESPLLTRPDPHGFAVIVLDLKVAGVTCKTALRVAGQAIAGQNTGDWDCTTPQDVAVPYICRREGAAFSFTPGGGAE